MLDDDDLASLDLYQLDDWASSIDTSLRRCNRSHDILVREETDEALLVEDEKASKHMSSRPEVCANDWLH